MGTVLLLVWEAKCYQAGSVSCPGKSEEIIKVLMYRSQGLLLDNMLSAEVVLADGRSVMTSKVRHPDLFWVGMSS